MNSETKLTFDQFCDGRNIDILREGFRAYVIHIPRTTQEWEQLLHDYRRTKTEQIIKSWAGGTDMENDNTN